MTGCNWDILDKCISYRVIMYIQYVYIVQGYNTITFGGNGDEVMGDVELN
jgi:hypothetical protein